MALPSVSLTGEDYVSMIEMIIVWAIVPLLLTLLCFGFGLAFSLITRKPMNFILTVVMGFLLMAILGSITTLSTATAPYTAIAFGVISLLGLLTTLIWFRSRLHFDLLPSIAGFITYALFSLPTVVFGHPSWVGWIKLDDDSTFLAVTDRLMKVGRTIPVPIASTFDRVLQTVFSVEGSGHFSYPVGTFIPFGVISKLTGVEKAWFFQPYLTFAAAMVAAVFVLVLRARFANRILVVAIATVSSLASTIYSYVMWGGVKEIVLIIPVTLFGFAVFDAMARKRSIDTWQFILVAFFGILVVGGTAGVGYAAPIIFIAVLLILWKKNHRYFQYVLGATGIAAAVLIIMLKSGNKTLTNLFIPFAADKGNLVRSLNMAQVMGIWPSQDFRMDPAYKPLTILLIGIAFLFMIAGLYFSIVSANWLLPSLVAGCVAVVSTSYFWGGIWLTGKAIAIASPIFLLVTFVGVYETWLELGKDIWRRFAPYRLRLVVIALAGAVGCGVIASDSFTYKNVSLAPYSQQNELRNIGQMFTGQGPTLMTEYSVYGARYFLRALGAEAVSELRVHLIPTRDGNQVPRGYAADIDLFDPSTINYYNLLVLRRSPDSSRPPVNYSLAWSGRYYEVWRKMSGVVVKATLPLGGGFNPGSVPTCAAVDSFLLQRNKTDRIYAATRNPVFTVDLSAGELPPTAQVMAPYMGAVNFTGAGGFNRNFSVGATGRYDMWVAGSYPGRLKVLIDGRQVYSGNSVLEANLYLTNPLNSVELSVGSHVLTILYDRPLWMPGSDLDSVIGPIFFSTQTAGNVSVKQVSIARIPKLCTQNLDWIAIAN
jgi:hypothetical protein